MLQAQDARWAWRHAIRDGVIVVAHAVFLLAAGVFVSLLMRPASTDSIGDEAGWAAGILVTLGLPLLALVIAGARLAPALSAAVPPPVIFLMPWSEFRQATILILVWLASHIGILIWCVLRRPTGRRSPAHLAPPPCLNQVRQDDDGLRSP